MRKHWFIEDVSMICPLIVTCLIYTIRAVSTCLMSSFHQVAATIRCFILVEDRNVSLTVLSFKGRG
jgi:hypothetical protein